jgi:hypothetical protein
MIVKLSRKKQRNNILIFKSENGGDVNPEPVPDPDP